MILKIDGQILGVEDEDKFMDEFIVFLESRDLSFAGITVEVDDNGNEVK